MSFLKTDKSNLVEPKVKTTPQNVAESNDSLFRATMNLPNAAKHCGMTEKDIMERISAIMDGRKITFSDGGPVHKSAGQKPVYSICLQGQSASYWTELMKPYLGKRRQEKYEFIMEKLNEIS